MTAVDSVKGNGNFNAIGVTNSASDPVPNCIFTKETEKIEMNNNRC